MKYLKIFALTIANVVAAPVIADVTLHLDPNMELLVANGEEVKHNGSFTDSEGTVTLPNGENQIAFRYSYLFEDGSDDREVVESDVFIAKFSAQDTELSFLFPTFRSVRDAEEKIQDLQWSLNDIKANKAVTVGKDKLFYDGFQFTRDFVREVEDYNKTNGLASVSLSNVANATPTEAEEMLYFWYAKADEETKARFKEFVNKQN